MTVPDMRPTPVPDPVEAGPASDADFELTFGSASWPVTRLANGSMLLLLAASLVGPLLVAGHRDVRWLALFLPGIAATAGARVVFEALDARPGPRRLLTHLPAALGAGLLASLLLSAAVWIVGAPWSLLAGGATAVLSTAALVGAAGLRDLEIRVRLALQRVFFAGSGEARRDLERELRRRSDSSFVGAIAIEAPLLDAGTVVAAVIDAGATVLVLDRDAMRDPAIVEAAARLNLAGLHIRELVGYYESEFKKVPLAELSPTWFLFDIGQIHRQPRSQLLRRGAETAFAGLLFVLSLPVLALAMIAVRLTSSGPVLYRQPRVGLGGEEFTLLKLRTMTTLTPEASAWAESQHHRVTPVGRFLRRFRLDELPQLWNVVTGDLALIGPRPEQVPLVALLEKEIPFYGARHVVRPGLTGWAQVNVGYAGSVEGTVVKLQRDLYYIKHANLRLDALILWLTVKTVVSGRG